MPRLNGSQRGALVTVAVVGASGLFGWTLRNTWVLSDVKVESATIGENVRNIENDVGEIKDDIRRILDKLNEE